MTNLKRRWQRFRHARPGERFKQFHDRQRQDAPGWARALYPVATIACLAIGGVLAVIPGPAIPFFLLAAALLAAQSATVARWLDRAEVRIREWGPVARRLHPGNEHH